MGFESGFGAFIVGHFRVTCTVAGGAVTVAAISEENIKGVVISSRSTQILGAAGVLCTFNMSGFSLPANSRVCLHGLHDPAGNFGFLALFQPTVIMSEPSATSIVLGIPFQPVIPADGQYAVDATFSIIRV